MLAHGAGTNQDHQSIITLREGLAAHGHPVLTFNYPYTEQGKRRPDRADVLLACHRAATKWLQQRCDDVVFAGRSMGGRIATHLAAEGESCVGVVLYSYPLHPAGKPEKLRKDHLPDIAVPMLFFSGDQDALALPDLVDEWIRPLPTSTVISIPDADHSFRVPKRSGKTQDVVYQEIIVQTSEWVNDL